MCPEGSLGLNDNFICFPFQTDPKILPSTKKLFQFLSRKFISISLKRFFIFRFQIHVQQSNFLKILREKKNV